MSPRPARRRGAPRGLTLIEITIAIAIAAVLFAAVTVGIGALTGAKAKGSATELAGVIRSLYDSAALSGKTCRLVFVIPDPKREEPTKYHAECAAGGITTARDRDNALREDERDREQAARSGGGQDDRKNYMRSDNASPSAQELMEQEKTRIESQSTFSAHTAEEISPRELPSGVAVSVWTRHQREPVESGVAYLYFFPQGYTEKAMVFLRQGDNAWTLDVSPLTGKVNIASEALEVPRT
ncbi:prepilin-type N-terminal cleavage/methylation domain-containing protein [Corallococcus sp. ZKHCc1 1396]|uniref:Prepilin-type N-terminal cleavage/methylation domain-containing protein n=1 Tax=Corallococcus soli TaxID=2710757 RepID=A0ABR9PT12_9BACT|nr:MULTISPECIES: prepilin-type N-terminal cleavage/methylation domain-containing protein [Corallococcus]MBE4751062.1 prepilin-type N-terminal cleavage/methylation domain-containing protein [Corallococcus soli]MCY1034188.1 prepilin-type N-terminal cleavage/methylation domain-containing protein [Corallococcus sp. BB11-1]